MTLQIYRMGFFVALVSALLAGPAFAESKTKAKNKSKNKNAPKTAERSETAKDDASDPDAQPKKLRSEDNRLDKKVTVLAEIGLIDVLHSGYGAQVGYFLSPRLVLEADYFTANFSFLGYESTVGLATARGKYFVGNSFYVHGGLGLRSLDQSDRVTTLIDTGKDDRSSFRANTLVGEVGIGNRWQWSNFTLGCDWVGYIAPIAQMSSSETFGSDVTDDSKDSKREDFEREKTKGNLLAVRFALGWSF